MQNRYTPRINVTIPPELLASIKRYEQTYHWKRSNIIQAALEQWLAKQQPLAKNSDESTASKRQYDPQKSFKTSLKPGISEDEILDTLLEYEAATEIHWSPHG